MSDLAESEKEREYLLMVIAAAVQSRWTGTPGLDYTIDRLTRVVKQATESGHDDLRSVAQGELDLARRVALATTP